MPRVSVVMGVFNAEKTIQKAIESILEQTFTDFELVICDDCSTDQTGQILARYQTLDPRVVVVRTATNGGLAVSLNAGIAVARGEYIARMDDDDISRPDRLERQVAVLDERDDIALVASSAVLFDELGSYGEIRRDGVPTAAEVYQKSQFIHPTVVMRREPLLSVNGYTEAPYTRRGQDYDLWNKLYRAGFIGLNLSEPLLEYRQGRQSYAKRKLRHRAGDVRMRIIWRRRWGFSWVVAASAITRILVAAAVPKGLMFRYHRWQGSRRAAAATTATASS
jgi:glycosyltransferase EpsE